MNKFERMMLDNCRVLFRYLWLKENNIESGDGPLLIEQANKIRELLNPKVEESACEMGEEEICKCGHTKKEHFEDTGDKNIVFVCTGLKGYRKGCKCKKFVKRGREE